MRVTELWRFPVKSLQGERIESTPVGVDGLAHDRRWALLDLATGKTLTARREPALLWLSASVIDDHVVIADAAGTRLSTDAMVSSALGREVRLVEAADDVRGEYENVLDVDDEAGSAWVSWTGPTGSFHDSTRAKVTLVTAGRFGSWNRRRFRINVVLDAGDDDALVGSQVRLGDAVLDVRKQVDRCVMVTRPQPGGIEPDLDVLRAINAERDGNLGIGALVATPGVVTVGDTVSTVMSETRQT